MSKALLILLYLMHIVLIGSVAFQPDFAEPIKNMSVPVGRDATFQCIVHHLGGYRFVTDYLGHVPDNCVRLAEGHTAKAFTYINRVQKIDLGNLAWSCNVIIDSLPDPEWVGWVKADTKAIQAIHDHVITHNPRISVSHNDHVTWNLHIKNVQEEDRGQYMCQINTDPMKSQVGSLDVSVPPDFTEETSGDLLVPEGGTVKLTCRAKGHPIPHVQWRREDGKDIVIREPSGSKTKVTSYQGEMLQLWKISRTEMGAYMCIASNGVPPTVSKRVMVNVHFHPVIHVPNQLVGAPLGTDVTLECYVEAFPKSINYWVRDTGEMVISSNKYDVQAVSKSSFEVKMIVVIRSLQKEDVGSYRCIAKNSLGEVESNIRLYEIPGPTHTYTLSLDEEDYNDQLGSAERDQEEDFSNSVFEKHRPLGFSTSETPGKGIHSSERNNHVSNNETSAAGSRKSNVRLFVIAWVVVINHLTKILEI